MIAEDVLVLLKAESGFIDSKIHGLKHWQTVERNGHYLADFNGADKKVLSYFRISMIACVRMNIVTRVTAQGLLFLLKNIEISFL